MLAMLHVDRLFADYCGAIADRAFSLNDSESGGVARKQMRERGRAEERKNGKACYYV
ncbi:hypothetical protein BJ123_13122 [Rhodopseudomonas thermotolerans]|uniref:Uncharacterized protein n=2 Tax=Rhodopseudomonas TaxID=1073 RepID=A0A336JXT2_9BRAD|nr:MULTISPECIES: hypothetical protein [Rhodopseudomonas]RED25554.1 hypothetical protein BJ125_13122 [Rhodopseudomonas pentothenatexigens]REF90384.1 hypothetical protein BJ123_13122 [Rhodopseudomonas thermotolerans]SSW93166.1 hypothetical protein SAMN05892882_13122 [Rhodopseudomonas pentothenatexigens]